MTTHHIDVCAHGKVVSQCRCVGPKVTRVVPCPRSCPNPATNAQRDEYRRRLEYRPRHSWAPVPDTRSRSRSR